MYKIELINLRIEIPHIFLSLQEDKVLLKLSLSFPKK